MNNFFEINNVTFAASKKNKVNNVSLKIENEGDVVCLLGPSGIGKTTILRTIAGLEKIKSGSINLNGKVISSENLHIEPENRNISLSFQDNSLFPHYNVIDNIKFGAERNKRKNKRLKLNEILALGPSISVLMEGYQDLKVTSIRGTLVPAKTLNKLISKIPVLGDIVIPKEVGEGCLE